MLKLRLYQVEAVRAILADWASGLTDVLLTMCTGGGKTAVFLALLNDVLVDGKRGMVIAHRKELIDQPLARLHQYFPHWAGRAGIVMAEQNEPHAQLVIATVQTLNTPGRLEEVGQIDYLVTDECHHSIAATYRSVYEKLRAANPAMLHLGVTATPIRADGDGLSGIFQKESYHYGIIEGIRTGYLAPVRWLAIQTAVSVKGIASRDGDFVARQLKNVYETSNVFDLVVETHQKYAGGRQAVAFTVTVDGAYQLAETFRASGIKAEAADGTTNKRERSQILDRFQGGETDVLCNVGLYTEGLDVPQASCIHQVRPTRSDGLYTQMVGRALRIYPGKEDALVLDYAPLEVRNIAMMGDVLGTPLRKDAYVEEKDEQGDVLGGFTYDGSYNWLEGNPAEIISRQLNYLDISPWSWYRRDGFMSLGLGKGSDDVERTLVIGPPQDGMMSLYLVAKRDGERSWRAYDALVGATWEEISEWAEDYAGKRGNSALAAKARSWRRQPASDAQIKFAKRFKGAYRPGMSKGECAQSITHAIALQAIEKKRLVSQWSNQDYAWIGG